MERIRMGPLGQKPLEVLEWDETGHNVISLINVSFNRCGITSIQFGYVETGALVMSETYGKSTDFCSRRILKLNHDSEFVTGISGEFVPGIRGLRGWLTPGYISLLRFHTNQRTHEVVHSEVYPTGKVGHEKMEFHSGILEGREFGGFFGSCSESRLTSIGFYVRLGLHDVKTIKKENL